MIQLFELGLIPRLSKGSVSYRASLLKFPRKSPIAFCSPALQLRPYSVNYINSSANCLRKFGNEQSIVRRYSTATAPPPPPPPPQEKNAKGRLLLNKITRAFTFSMSSVLVIFAGGVSLLVIYLIFSELFLPSGETRTFNKAVKLVENSDVAKQVLHFESGERLKAYGEVAADKWARNRPPQCIRTKTSDGKDHLLMKFHVESKSGHHGTVVLEQIDESFWSSEFAYIALDQPGKRRVYIKEPKFTSKRYVPSLSSKNGSFLGLKWGPKKDDD
ncbi:Piso0_002846 [Millerozyma farinosa CBS 7064]|uniref:Mitochondrial import inner membrane translocase subunit Tim21 n=1 Tax=Pichia sorbitophila (strain ATCC MYA-4447 / BCRC 22081 / CBS 7064 / NBRC 10061 / NRRL Y-12695) TaxID=559304 RepID=G8YG48_PICSO|nr:Piso0_002846 [Millerozyma farinosa CBS 7064]